MRGLLIGAPASAQGKTTLTLGLLRALGRRGVDIASAKSGPDYIDPAFHAAATGRPCLTLDPWAATPGQLRARAVAHAAELLVVEGAMGLYDGAATTPAAAPALPIPPVPACATPRPRSCGQESARNKGSRTNVQRGQSAPARRPRWPGHSACPCCWSSTSRAWARAPPRWCTDSPASAGAPAVAGVVLNRAGSERHAALVRGAVEGVRPVLGVLPRRDDLAVPSRHLGLVQADEHPDLAAFLDDAADAVEAGCDLDAIAALAAPVAPDERPHGAPARLPPPGQRIAVARDAAFGFAYWHMLEDWRSAGAEVVPFSPLADQPPDADADAVFLPGGYPELHPGRISAALSFQAGMRAAIDRGAIVYGECGGFMVLGDGLVDAEGARHAMLGLLRLETSVARPARVLGYRRLAPLGGPWPGPLAGHEFHTAVALRADGRPLFAMRDAAGTDLGTAGLVDGRVSGSFAHVIEPATG